ncbi:MAG: NUDIX domain-containing protein, partial [Terriglobales bacterium]
SSATTAVEFGPAITLEQVKEFLKVSKMEIAAAIDGGICPAANHLTIIDCLADKPGAVRSGLVHARAVNAALGKVAEALDPISVESLLQISEASPPVTTLQMRPEETQMQTISRRSARAILLNEANELGLIKRTKLSQLPYWTTPGGGIEETDKSLEDALRRELREELGAEINELQQVTLISTPATDGTVSVQHFFVCRLAELDTNRRSGPELNDASRGGYDFEFVALEELDTVDLKPAEIRTFIHSNRVALISFDQ